MSQTRNATLTVDFTFTGPDSANKKLIERRLRSIVNRAYEDGTLTGRSDLEIKTLKMDVKAHPTPEEKAQSAAELEELLASLPDCED